MKRGKFEIVRKCFNGEEAQNFRSTNRVGIGAGAQEALDAIKQEPAKTAEKRNKMSSFQPDGTNVNVAAEIIENYESA